VVSRVLNLREISPQITHERLCDALISSFMKTYQLDEKDVESISIGEKEASEPHIKPYVDRLSNWDWRFGHSPAFTYQLEEVRFDWGVFDVNIQSDGGKITEVVIYSDSLFPDLVTLIMDHLAGKTYSKEGEWEW
jgi:lipoate-protein ligase A